MDYNAERALQEIYYRQSVTQNHNRIHLGNGTDHTVQNVENSSIFGKQNQKYKTCRN